MIVACIYISIYLNIFIGINTVMGGATWPDLLGNQSKYDCIEISKTFALVMNWWAVPLQPLNFIVASPFNRETIYISIDWHSSLEQTNEKNSEIKYRKTKTKTFIIIMINIVIIYHYYHYYYYIYLLLSNKI